MSGSGEGEKGGPSVSSRIAAFLILVACGIVILFILLRLSSVLLKGLFCLLGSFVSASFCVDLLIDHATSAFLGTFLILAVAFGVLLKTVLLRKSALIRRLRDTAFGSPGGQ